VPSAANVPSAALRAASTPARFRAATIGAADDCDILPRNESSEGCMLKKVAFTMFPVKDTARARAFYEETLGLRVGSHGDNGVWTEYDFPGGGCLALFNHPDPKSAAAPGGASIAFEVEDLDVLVAQLKGKGVKFMADDVQSPVCRMAIIQDSEGNGIILHKLKRDV
jgi:predicted enzyme related to lactoylglutathione lyase